MALTAGTKLGPYEIQAPLGAGGMGEVYRARDAKLGREVALKVLPEALARDAERIGRFEREAKVLASLNHPNIAAIYGFEDSSGVHALVMELVEGSTLAERIARSPIPITEALPVAKQVCEALEYAHEHGIVHRDLKPANIKITADGAVKVLDFGLAKALEVEPASADIANSPTITQMATQAGYILGTAAYMSPEQAKGKSVDRRTDIWAFGCVFYEMLTGQAVFAGETVTDILASLIKSEPDWTLLPPDTPRVIRNLLERCLKKNARQRLQAIGEARIAIEETMAGADAEISLVPASAPRLSMWRRVLPWAAALAAGALLSGFAVWALSLRSPHAAAMRFRAVTNFAGVQSDPALSPDGRSVAFVSNRDGHYNIYIGLISGGNLVKLTDDPNLKVRPSWSPDGTEIAYARLNDSGIWDAWKVPAFGGVVRRLILNAKYPTWSHDGRTLAYVNSATGAIWISEPSGQNARELASTRSPGRRSTEPRFSPDGREIVFTLAWPGPYRDLEIVDVDSGKMRQLTHDDALVLSPAWSPDGRFIYFSSSRGGTVNIWKIAENGGEPEQITAGQGDDAQLDISADGKQMVFSTLHYNANIAQLDLNTTGQQNAKLLTTDPARNQGGPAYSPDGKHIAYFSYLKGAEREGVWLANVDGSNAVQLVQDDWTNVFPRFTPDSGYLVYPRYSAPSGSEYRRVSISGGVPQTLLKDISDGLPDVGPDGQLLFQGTRGQIQTFNSGDTRTLFTLTSEEDRFLFRWSPDHHSIAYAVSPSQENDSNAGLWLDELKGPPRQVFRGWVSWYARGPKNEIYLVEGKADLNGVLWKLDWNGQGLARVPVTVPLAFDYWAAVPSSQFDISPDGRHVAFTNQGGLQANIGMLENIH
jgi:eukaryotic-like serine/threonine-protein kinase